MAALPAMNTFRATLLLGLLLGAAVYMWSSPSADQALRRDRRAPTTWQANYPDQCAKQGHIAVTYAEGPAERLTLSIVDQLGYIGGRGVRASFFPVASYLNDVVLQTSVKYAQQKGHVVGFRFPTGVDPRALSDADLKATMCQSANKVSEAIGVKGQWPKYVMLPFGQVDQRVDLAVRKLGFQPVSWNIDSMDYNTNKDDCTAIPKAYREQLGRLPAGWGKFIALQHDMLPCTQTTMDEVFNLIVQYNYTAVPMDVCLGDSSAYLTSLDCDGVTMSDPPADSGSPAPASPAPAPAPAPAAPAPAPSPSSNNGASASPSAPKPNSAQASAPALVLAGLLAAAVARRNL
ncbi:hypothetical protein DFJ74DRAFT_709403 [Hyaloraphidium curvatum]|nr:hypothetical protein DFJ74DRAFT_709403 [Hyaloraphidium curvatum]